jgi:flavodoxin
MKKALIVYYSQTGNTEKVAQAIRLGLKEAGVEVDVKKPQEASSVDYFSFVLVILVHLQFSGNPPSQLTIS